MKKRILIILSIFVLFIFIVKHLSYFNDSNIKLDNPTIEEVLTKLEINTEGLDDVLAEWQENNLNDIKYSGIGTFTLGIYKDPKGNNNKFFIPSSSFGGIGSNSFYLTKDSDGNSVRKLTGFKSFVNRIKYIFSEGSISGQVFYEKFNIQEKECYHRYFFEYNIYINEYEVNIENKEFLVSNIAIANKFPYKTGFYPAKYYEIKPKEGSLNTGKYLIVVVAKFD